MTRSYFIYILSNKTCTTVYIGVTNSLKGRIAEHKSGEIPGFTRTYNVNRLVYFEEFQNINDAISREKQLKKWRRAWKDELIKTMNPSWRDLFDEIGD